MKITLSNIHYSARMSEETSCFTATVNIDGKPAFIATNRGTGGCDDYDRLNQRQSWDEMNANIERVKAYAATLPIRESDFDLPQTIESLVGDALHEWLLAKDFKRLTAKKIVVIDNGVILTVQNKKPPKDLSDAEREHIRRDILARRPKAEFLNFLPEAEGLAKYIAAAQK